MTEKGLNDSASSSSSLDTPPPVEPSPDAGALPALRYSYTWRKRRPEDLAQAFYACQRCDAEDQPFGLYSELERAHLDGDRTNDAPENVAVLCRTCHRRLDHAEWLALYRAWLAVEREKRIDRMDAERPILKFLAVA